MGEGEWVGMKFWDVGAIPNQASAARKTEAEICRSTCCKEAKHSLCNH